MRITNLQINNFQGLHHAALVVSEPLLLVSGSNGAGKSSLLDAISMAFSGQPRRVSLKKDIGQLVTEGAKKGEAVVSWLRADGEEESAAVALPSGKGAPLVDMPFLPFVLDASKFATLDGKERRKMLFELTGASASPNEAAKRLIERGADATLVEKIKPMLRAGFPAAADQAKEYASEERGSWKSIAGEAYGSEKAADWQPEVLQVEVTQAEIDAAVQEVVTLQTDLDEANQTLGAHKAAAQAEAGKRARIAELTELAGLVGRRQIKLDKDSADLAHWQGQLASTQGGKQGLAHDLARCLSDFQALSKSTKGVQAENGLLTPWFTMQEVDRMDLVLQRYAEEHGPVGDGDVPAELAKRAPEFQTYVTNLTRTVENSQRDLRAAQDAAVQLAELQAEPAAVPSPEAIANAEQLINSMRQQLDQKRAKQTALQDAFNAIAGREQQIAKAAKHHAAVKSWVLIAEALAPAGIPSEILAGALEPINSLLAIQSAAAKWNPVQISLDIEVTYGGRVYGLLSESEKWRCDALLAIAIARLSGIGLVTLDRFDVLQPSARPQILGLLRTLTQGGDLNSAILAGTMKEPMAKVPAGIQSVWIESGVIGGEPVSAAA